MAKKKLTRTLAAVMACTMLIGSASLDALAMENGQVQAAEAAEAQSELQVQFEQEYAEVGKVLSVAVTGAADVSYAWYVGGTRIDNTTNSYTPTADDLEKFIKVTVTSGTGTASAEMYFSKLPVVYIDTENGAAIVSKEDYINADMRIQGNSLYNSENSTLYNGAIEIRGRGNSTWGMPKKPYKIKLDKKTSVFDMGKNKHWVLLANYSDESLMRNTLAYDFSGELGMEHMSTVWTTVIMNGEYVGNYQFCEQIRVDSTRVDVFDWEGLAEDSADVIAEAAGMDADTTASLEEYMLQNMGWITSGKVTFNGTTYRIADYPEIEIPSIDGGYLLEMDEYYDEISKFKTETGQPIMFKNPEFVNTNQAMINYVRTYVQSFENAVHSSDYTADYEGAETHYSELYDFDALVDYWIVNEIFFNEEFNKKSTYMYKEIGELMTMGPMWDMDYSSGGEGATGTTNQWATLYFNRNAQKDQWYKYLVQDPYFLTKVQERYWEIRYAQVTDMLASIDEHYEYLKESGAANSARWPRQPFESDVQGLRNWMNAHLTWMDAQMDTEDSLAASFYTADSNLQLALADTDGTALKSDLALKASADYKAESGQDLVLSVTGTDQISGNAEVYVNSRKAGTLTVNAGTKTVTLSADLFTAEINKKDTVEVKVYNTAGDVIAANYVTVREMASESETGVNKSRLEELIYEAIEKQSSNYRKDTWTVFDAARSHAYTVYYDVTATQETVDAAAAALETAMNALVELRDPSDASDDYDLSKITYTAGTEQNGEGIEKAFDENEGTIWHSQYSPRPEWYGTEEALNYFWVTMELEEPAVIEAVRYLPRNGNGDITGYRVEGSNDGGETWVVLTEGTWERTAGWKAAEFDAKELTHVRLWATATVSGSGNNKHVSAAELRLRTGNVPVTETEIPLTEMTATAGDWEENGGATEGPAQFAIDHDENTMWHTDWYEGPNYDNHWLQLELNSAYMVDGFKYLPRQTGNTNGIITEYKILVSMDGENWTEAASGKWAADREWKVVKFDAVKAKYVRLKAEDSLTDTGIALSSAAEVRVTGNKAVFENPFTDITEQDYFYDAVLWAVNAGITEGWTETTFEPGKTCTRGQVVTFLWRANGSQTAEEGSGFSDVAADAYYADAAAWAVKEGITEGWTETTFEPEMTVTRGQVVTFLWRANGSQTAEEGSGFSDVAADAYYADAVAWAIEKGITEGWSENEFAPDMGCTRGQIVIFLYRAENQ
ncbi:MAG: discoidin domain-containing protein [Lachnospiraceae bacterium]